MKLERTEITPRQPADEDLRKAVESAQQALDTIPRSGRKRLRFVASGTAGTELPAIAWEGAPPGVAVVERVYAVNDPQGDLAATPRGNFRMSAIGVVLFEPSGLTANTAYELVVNISEVL